jgi:hypothetical protein
MSDQRRYEAYLRLDTALLHDPAAAALEPATGWRLRELAGRLLCVRDDGRELVQEAAALLSGLVAAGTLSDETADLLWLDVAACAAVRRFTSRPAAEASIA